MYVLIFWTKDKNVSVVSEKDLCNNVIEEGETTTVRYADNKFYKGKVVKKSFKFVYMILVKIYSIYYTPYVC